MISIGRNEGATGDQVKFVTVAPIIVKADESEDEEEYATPNISTSL